MALAISEAFDAILVRLARSLRDSEATGRRGGLQRPATAVPHTAMAQALGMGLFVDAYEDVVVSLIQAFAFLTSEERKAHSQAQSADQAQRRFVPTEQLLDRRPKIRTGASNGSPPSSSRSGRGLLVVGEDVQKRRQAWVQRKLEVLGESVDLCFVRRMKVLNGPSIGLILLELRRRQNPSRWKRFFFVSLLVSRLRNQPSFIPPKETGSSKPLASSPPMQLVKCDSTNLISVHRAVNTAEVTTTMSTFRMGQLRVHRIVTRFCWPTDTT